LTFKAQQYANRKVLTALYLDWTARNLDELHVSKQVSPLVLPYAAIYCNTTYRKSPYRQKEAPRVSTNKIARTSLNSPQWPKDGSPEFA